MNYTTFHKFPELPFDVRSLIWDIAISDLSPRVVYVRERKAFEYSGQFSRVRNDWATDTPPPIIEPVTFLKKKKMVIVTKQEEGNLYGQVRNWGKPGAWFEGKGTYPRQREEKVGISSAYDFEDGIEFLDKEVQDKEVAHGFEYGELVWSYPLLSPRPVVESPPGFVDHFHSGDPPDAYDPKYCYTMRSLGSDWVMIEFQYFLKGPREHLQGFARTCSIPSLLLVCRESFNIASRSYKRILSRRYLPATNYFNPKNDILFLNNPSLFCLSDDDCEKIQKVAIGRPHNDQLGGPFSMIAVAQSLHLFRNVEELFLVTELDSPTEEYEGKEELDIVLTSPDALTDEGRAKFAQRYGAFPNVRENVEACLDIWNRVAEPAKMREMPERMGHFLASRREDLVGLLAVDLENISPEENNLS